MRSILSIFAIITLTFGVVAQTNPVFEEPVSGPKITFKQTTHDFGEIKQGDVVEHVFTFTNTGNAPLVLNNVQVTCGCTVPKWPREPIAPGASGSITVQFNSRGKIGMQNKTITILSNAVNNTERIRITTNIQLPDTQG